MADPLAAQFGRPFAEQMTALRLRLANQVGTVAWDDLVGAEHERAFVVAGALKADLLADLAKATERAIGEHRSLDKFRAEFKQIVADRGWHGWTGEGTAKGEAWRTKVIYKTNMATSYAAGRMAQLVKTGYKFWVYKHGNALEPRLQHLAWDGIALPPDHPFWETHAPPNGWGCTCRIRGAFSERGIKVAGGDPNKKLPDGWQTVSPKTGAQVGIDKGWDYNVGASVADDVAVFTAKLPTLPARIGSDFGVSASLAVDAAWSEWVAATTATGGQAKPGLLGVIAEDVLTALEQRGIAPQSAGIQVNPGLLAGPKARRHATAGDALSPDDWGNLPKAIRNPLAVLQDVRTGKLIYILPAEVGRAQLAVELDYRMDGAPPRLLTNMVVSAYRPAMAEVLRRIANGTLKVLVGGLG